MLNKFYAMTRYDLSALQRLDTILDQQTEDFKFTSFVAGGRGFIHLVGPILCSQSKILAYTHGTTYETIADAVKGFVYNDTAREIIFLANSPGGDLLQCQAYAAVVRHYAKLKPITTLVRGQLCSGALWLLSSTKILLSSETDEAGSVGVRLSSSKPSEFYASGPLKGVTDREASPGREKYIEDSLQIILRHFLTDLSLNRGPLSDDQLLEISRGGTFFGSDAIRMGLADGFFDPGIWHDRREIVKI
ncbi:MAG: hypothetical protein OEW04_03565 [Nitrospirota bacterium]|nr:hypothetical protein [Nitrospirota bacterium]